MKILTILSFLLIFSCAQNSKNRSPASTQIDDIHLPGEVITSLLTPQSFREKYGPVWVLMDGGSDLENIFKQYPEVTLADLEMDSIPDARGKFLRMHNGDRVCEKNKECAFNPDNTPLGGVQSDALKYHNVTHPSIASRINIGGHNYVATWWDYNNGREGPPHKTYGDAHESRPKNVTVNFFVKVATCPVEYNGMCR